MKILKVIHEYPMRYNAGSEVYSQTLCHGLVKRGHSVDVFAREEDPFAPDFDLRTERDVDDERIIVHLVNNPRMKDRYCVAEIDDKFAKMMLELCPTSTSEIVLNDLGWGADPMLFDVGKMERDFGLSFDSSEDLREHVGWCLERATSYSSNC